MVDVAYRVLRGVKTPKPALRLDTVQLDLVPRFFDHGLEALRDSTFCWARTLDETYAFCDSLDSRYRSGLVEELFPGEGRGSFRSPSFQLHFQPGYRILLRGRPELLVSLPLLHCTLRPASFQDTQAVLQAAFQVFSFYQRDDSPESLSVSGSLQEKIVAEGLAFLGQYFPPDTHVAVRSDFNYAHRESVYTL